MSPAEARAASPGDWGRHGSSDQGPRYATTGVSHWATCRCCGNPQDHVGWANGVALFWGCEWSVRRWVRDPHAVTRQLWEAELHPSE